MAFNDGAFQPIPYAEFQPVTDPAGLYTSTTLGGQLQEVAADALSRQHKYWNRS